MTRLRPLSCRNWQNGCNPEVSACADARRPAQYCGATRSTLCLTANGTRNTETWFLQFESWATSTTRLTMCIALAPDTRRRLSRPTRPQPSGFSRKWMQPASITTPRRGSPTDTDMDSELRLESVPANCMLVARWAWQG